MGYGRNAALFGLLALAACNKTPSGQVVATVNGEEITRQELNATISAARVPAKADKMMVQRAALAQLVQQRLVVQAAKRQSLDKTPDYLAASRRASDSILAQMLAESVARQVRNPFGSTVDAFVAANPTRFGQREILTVEQIRFAWNPAFSSWIKDAHSLDAIIVGLQQRNVPFDRGRAQIDSATVTPDIMAKLNALPPGEPFSVPQGGLAVISVISDRKAAPLNGDATRRAATSMIRQQAIQDSLTKELTNLTDKAKIDYQPGFAPPPVPKPPAPAQKH